MERFRDLVARWLINRAADKIILNGTTPEALAAADRRWREHADAMKLWAKCCEEMRGPELSPETTKWLDENFPASKYPPATHNEA